MEKYNIDDLVVAIERNDIAVAHCILQSGCVDVNGRVAIKSNWNPTETTALIKACELNRYEIACLLLAYGADVNGQSSNRNFPLFAVIENEAKKEHHDFKFLDLICSYSPNFQLERQYHGVPLFYVFSHKPDQEIFEYLLSQGADIDFIDSNDETLLMRAVRLNRIRDVELLLDYGADIYVENRHGGTAISIAVVWNRINVARYFLSLDANVHQAYKAGDNILFDAVLSGNVKMLLLCSEASGIGLDTINDDHSSLLSEAAYADKVKIIDYLLSQGLDINHKTIYGLTPLDIAIEHESFHAANYLIKRGAACQLGDRVQEYHLQCAIKIRDFETVDALLKNNVNSQICDDKDVLLIHKIASRKEPKLMEIFLNNNVALAKNELGDTPLHTAIKKGQLEIVKLLIDYGMDVHEKNNLGKTAMDLAKSKPLIKNYIECYVEQNKLESLINKVEDQVNVIMF